MEAKLISQEARRAAREVGPHAELYITINAGHHHHGGKPICCALYARGVTSDCALRIEVNTWEELFPTFRAEWAKHAEKARSDTIRKMALEIIRLTAEGNCTDAALRGDQFTSEEIAEYGAEACLDANQIASNGPFVIATLKNANAA